MAQDAPTACASDLIPKEALERVPGYSAATARIEKLTGGTVNRSFVVHASAGRYFLRLHEQAGLELGANHAREASLQRAAAAAGLAPPLVYADPGHRFAISEFLSGRVWTPEDFEQSAQIRKLGAMLRRVHDVLPPVAAPFELRLLLEGFVARIGHAAPAERARLNRWSARASTSLQASGSDGRQETLFHSDPHHSNLIERPDGALQLVDWEYAAVGDPLYDLACVLAYYPAAERHAQVLLQAAGLAGAASPSMLAHATWLYTLLGYLWYRARRLDAPADTADLQTERTMLDRLG